jgi:hypothetical protein
MSIPERGRPVAGNTTEEFPTNRYSGQDADETKASFKTTELWTAIVGVVALIVVYNASADLSLDLFRACLLCTILAGAYIVSRGLAKSASRARRTDGGRDRSGY